MEKGRNYLIKLFKSTYPKNKFLLQDIKRNKILPPTTRNVERFLAHGTEQRNTLLTFFFHFLYRKKYIYSTLAVPTVPERIFSLFLAVLERDGVKNSLLSLAVPTVLLAPGITNL